MSRIIPILKLIAGRLRGLSASANASMYEDAAAYDPCVRMPTIVLIDESRIKKSAEMTCDILLPRGGSACLLRAVGGLACIFDL